LSDLPPGVTVSALEGGGWRYDWNVVPEDFREITRAEWEEEGIEESSVSCFRCSDVVGLFIGRSYLNPDVERYGWVTCYELPDDKIVCDDCKTVLLDQVPDEEDDR
jgi:hypothetical protein